MSRKQPLPKMYPSITAIFPIHRFFSGLYTTISFCFSIAITTPTTIIETVRSCTGHVLCSAPLYQQHYTTFHTQNYNFVELLHCLYTPLISITNYNKRARSLLLLSFVSIVVIVFVGCDQDNE